MTRLAEVVVGNAKVQIVAERAGRCPLLSDWPNVHFHGAGLVASAQQSEFLGGAGRQIEKDVIGGGFGVAGVGIGKLIDVFGFAKGAGRPKSRRPHD